MQPGKDSIIMLTKNPSDNPIQETESKRLKAHFHELEKPILVPEDSSKREESTEKSECRYTKGGESRCNAITSTTVANRSEGAVEEMNCCSGRERLKRHRMEVAGQVWIPDIWGQENFLKDWIDCAAFDASLVNSRIVMARASLMDEGRRANSTGLRVDNGC